MRKAGVLMPVSALPSRIGARELGETAFHFIELLKENHVKIWQILPLNPVGYGNSPYQPYSSCAGDELYISLDALAEEGLLKEHPKAVSYTHLDVYKRQVQRSICGIAEKAETIYGLHCRQGF